MKYFCSLVLIYTLLLNTAFGASGSGNTSYVTNQGGAINTATLPGFTYPVSAATGVVTLTFGTSSSGAASFYNFWSASSPATSTAYQVPVGKTLVIFGFYFTADGTGDRFLFGYGTSAASGGEGGTAPTGPVYYAPSATTYVWNFANTTPTWTPISMSFPASSFPFLKVETGSAAHRGIAMGVLL